MIIKSPTCAAIALALSTIIAGCQGGGSGKPSDWAADTCKTFPGAAASKVAGVAVAKAESSGQTSNDMTVLSNCAYSTADGKTNFAIMLRQTKAEGQSIDEQIAGITSQPDVTGPSEAVAMPKGKAVWATRLNTLSYIPADGRMIVVTPPGAITFGTGGPPPGDLKAKAIAIATAVEG